MDTTRFSAHADWVTALSQVYDKDGRHVPACSTATLPKEVAELQQIFPGANPEALINALSVSDNNVNVAKAVSPWDNDSRPG